MRIGGPARLVVAVGGTVAMAYCERHLYDVAGLDGIIYGVIITETVGEGW